jgi:hypothetical protein
MEGSSGELVGLNLPSSKARLETIPQLILFSGPLRTDHRLNVNDL